MQNSLNKFVQQREKKFPRGGVGSTYKFIDRSFSHAVL